MTTSANFNSAKVPTGQELGLVPINEKIDTVVGNTPVILTRPSANSILVIQVTSGTFFFKPGAYDGNGANPAFPSDPSATTTEAGGDDGDAAWPVQNGTERAYTAPDQITVKGSSASDKMYYYWL